MATNATLTGLGLVIVLALGCELLASGTRLPAIVLLPVEIALLPVGFASASGPHGSAKGDAGERDAIWEGFRSRWAERTRSP